MKNCLNITFVSCFLLMGTASFAESMHVNDSKIERQGGFEEKHEEGIVSRNSSSESILQFTLNVGYRKDSLNWNEANESGSINIASELKWEDLEIAQLNAAAQLNFYADWNLRGQVGWGNISSGSNQDSDYNGNNRTGEFSRSNNKGGGEVHDASIGLGKVYYLMANDELSVMPLVGLSIHQQNLNATEGFQTVPATGAFPRLNNRYDARWQGPWVGIDGLLEAGGDWSLAATAEYHWADYYAQADWNLRSNFVHPVSFIHVAAGRGYLLNVGGIYKFRPDWRLRAFVSVQRWGTGAGVDRTYYTDGSVIDYPLNGVNWESVSFDFGMDYHF